MTLVILALTPLLALAGTSIAIALGRMDTASSKAYAGGVLPCRRPAVHCCSAAPSSGAAASRTSSLWGAATSSRCSSTTQAQCSPAYQLRVVNSKPAGHAGSKYQPPQCALQSGNRIAYCFFMLFCGGTP